MVSVKELIVFWDAPDQAVLSLSSQLARAMLVTGEPEVDNFCCNLAGVSLAVAIGIPEGDVALGMDHQFPIG